MAHQNRPRRGFRETREACAAVNQSIREACASNRRIIDAAKELADEVDGLPAAIARAEKALRLFSEPVTNPNQAARVLKHLFALRTATHEVDALVDGAVLALESAEKAGRLRALVREAQGATAVAVTIGSAL